MIRRRGLRSESGRLDSWRQFLVPPFQIPYRSLVARGLNNVQVIGRSDEISNTSCLLECCDRLSWLSELTGDSVYAARAVDAMRLNCLDFETPSFDHATSDAPPRWIRDIGTSFFVSTACLCLLNLQD